VVDDAKENAPWPTGSLVRSRAELPRDVGCERRLSGRKAALTLSQNQSVREQRAFAAR